MSCVYGDDPVGRSYKCQNVIFVLYIFNSTRKLLKTSQTATERVV